MPWAPVPASTAPANSRLHRPRTCVWLAGTSHHIVERQAARGVKPPSASSYRPSAVVEPATPGGKSSSLREVAALARAGSARFTSICRVGTRWWAIPWRTCRGRRAANGRSGRTRAREAHARRHLGRRLNRSSGHVLLVSGEAGVGKSALLKAFMAGHEGAQRMVAGRCDSLFTPRPMGPFLDIADQAGGALRRLLLSEARPHEVASAILADFRRFLRSCCSRTFTGPTLRAWTCSASSLAVWTACRCSSSPPTGTMSSAGTPSAGRRRRARYKLGDDPAGTQASVREGSLHAGRTRDIDAADLHRRTEETRSSSRRRLPQAPSRCR